MRLSVCIGFALAAMLIGGAQDAGAGVLTTTLESISAPDNGVYTYRYSIKFENPRESEFTINPGAALPPPTGGTPSGNKGTADFVTIYDIANFVSVSVDPAFASKWTTQTNNLIGIDGPLTAPIDSPSLTNVTIRYWGSGEQASFTHMNAILIKSTAGQTKVGNFTSQYTVNQAPNNKVGELGSVSVPSVVPEPSSLISAALGLSGLAGYAGWRRLRLRTGQRSEER